MIHTYSVIENNPIFEGMPKFTADFNPTKEDFPLHCYLLMKIATIPMPRIIEGKRYDGENIIYDTTRVYEFDLNTKSKNWGIMHLYIKREGFFNSFNIIKSVSNAKKQIIPLTYKTLSKMSNEELSIIFTDFD